MMSLTMRVFLVRPGTIETTLGSGDADIMTKTRTEIERLNLPNDVKDKVLDAAERMIQEKLKLPTMDLIGALAFMGLIRVIGEEFEIDTLQAVASLQTVLRNMGNIIDYNLDAHFFGNPPPPFKAVDTAGTPFDVGFIDLEEISELSDVLESQDLHEEDQDEFSEEHGIELLEELIEPLCEVLEEAISTGREIVLTTEG